MSPAERKAPYMNRETARANADNRLGSWTREEYEFLVRAAQDHTALTPEEVAQALGRTRGAISSRIKRLLPANYVRKGSWWNTLGSLLDENPQYDWVAALHENDEPLLREADYSTLATLESGRRHDILAAATLAHVSFQRATSLLRRHGIKTSNQSTAHYLLAQNLRDTEDHLPTRARPGDAGLDLRYCGSEPVALTSDEHKTLPTGVAIAVPQGYVGLISPIPELSTKHGVTVVNEPGLLEYGSTQEVEVCLGLIGTTNTCTIHPGERIAQLVLVPIITPTVTYVDSLSDSERNGED